MTGLRRSVNTSTSSTASESSGRRAHGRLLWLLVGVFGLRVTAQLAVAGGMLRFLPPFEAWHGGLLPYPALLFAQFAILTVCLYVAIGIWRGSARRCTRRGRRLLCLGGTYFAFMLARLVLGATLLTDSPWWNAPIPSVFHLVLAAFLIVVGHYHVAAR